MTVNLTVNLTFSWSSRSSILQTDDVTTLQGARLKYFESCWISLASEGLSHTPLHAYGNSNDLWHGVLVEAALKGVQHAVLSMNLKSMQSAIKSVVAIRTLGVRSSAFVTTPPRCRRPGLVDSVLSPARDEFAHRTQSEPFQFRQRGRLMLIRCSSCSNSVSEVAGAAFDLLFRFAVPSSHADWL